MNVRPGVEEVRLPSPPHKKAAPGMHDIGRSVIMGGSTAGAQTSIVTTTTNSTPGSVVVVAAVTGATSPAVNPGAVNGLSSSIASILESNSNSVSGGTSNNSESSGRNGVHHTNNNNCVKHQVIRCNKTANSSGGGLAGKEQSQSHVAQVTMSDGAADRPLSEVNNRPVPPIAVSSSSASSTASSNSSRSSSLSTSPMFIREEDEETVTAAADKRKVEPLKINLQLREPIRTVIKLGGGQSVVEQQTVHSSPKITIKPIPPVVVSSTNVVEDYDEEEMEVVSVDEENSASEMAGTIPKLHIRVNHQEEHHHHNQVNVTTTTLSPTQSQQSVIPKLTIRNATTGAAAVATNCSPSLLSPGAVISGSTPSENTVPKLTIKMDHLNQPHVPRLTIKTNSLGGHAIGSGGGSSSSNATTAEGGCPNEHLTVPKFTIKVPSEQVSPGGAAIISSSSSPLSEGTGFIPKLTLKNINKAQPAIEQQHQSFNSSEGEVASLPSSSPQVAAVPKLKVKLPRCLPPEQVEDDFEEEEEDSDSLGEEERIRPRIPKVTIKPVGGSPSTKFFSTNQVSGGESMVDGSQPETTMTKVVIKPIPKPENSLPHHHQQHSSNTQPLEVSTAVLGQVGPQSPRIILKINRNQNSVVSNSTEVLSTNEGAVENQSLLKRHLQQELQSTAKRCKEEERIIAMIDLDEEDSGPEQQMDKNGRGTVDDSSEQKERKKDKTKQLSLMSDENCVENNHYTQINVPGTERQVELDRRREEKRENNDGDAGDDDDDVGINNVDEQNPLAVETLVRLQPTTEDGGDSLQQTPVVKRGRGRPRKTPMVAREDFQETSNDTVLESNKKRGRKKKEEVNDVRPEVPAGIELGEAASDVDSPAFTPIRKPRGGGRGGGSASTRTPSGRGSRGARRGRGASSSTRKPFNKQKYFNQKTFEESISSSYFEEDTRMSAADSSVTKVTPMVGHSNDVHDSMSQSSHLSSTSVTMDSTQTSSLPARKKLKMEVVGTMEGKTEFTVDMLAEYDWPPAVGCIAKKNRDTYMIQEQIAEYLGVKSFKRKYPDLERRTVEMEERNHLMERGLVTEKMCDLGVTAVYAVDVLDIMYQDFHEKYEQYKQYHREKIVKDLTLRQKLGKGEFGLGAREKAMRSVSKWNATLNRTRKEERRIHMDLQNFTIQVPDAKRKNMTYPTQKPTIYPVALVVGQFSEYYRTYSPLELQCYPINTALTNPDDLMKRLLEEKMQQEQDDQVERDRENAEKAAIAVPIAAAIPGRSTSVAEENVKTWSESSSSDESNDSSDGDESVDSSSSSGSECDVNDDDLCCVCAQSQFTSPNNIPELFVKCAVCMKMAHPSCIEMSSEMANRAFQYLWQCVDCKRCQGCQKAEDQQRMLYCQQCDRAYHIYCTKNSLQSLPKGAWHCDICSICRRCGCRNPDGTNNRILKQMPGSPPGSLHQRGRPEWRHDYVVNPATRLKEHCGMLCIRCSQLPASSSSTLSTSVS